MNKLKVSYLVNLHYIQSNRSKRTHVIVGFAPCSSDNTHEGKNIKKNHQLTKAQRKPTEIANIQRRNIAMNIPHERVFEDIRIDYQIQSKDEYDSLSSVISKYLSLAPPPSSLNKPTQINKILSPSLSPHKHGLGRAGPTPPQAPHSSPQLMASDVSMQEKNSQWPFPLFTPTGR